MDIEIKLPRPHAAQRRVLNSKARFKILCAGRRLGKSLICQSESILRMVRGQRVCYITPTYNLAEDFYDNIIQLLPPALIKTQNKSRLLIKLITGGQMQFFSGESLRVRGKFFDLVIVDEAAHIPTFEKDWTESIRATLSDTVGDAIIISTPYGDNFFNALYQRGLNGDNEYESFHFTSYDNPYLKASEIDAAKAELPLKIFEQEYLAIPLSGGNNIFGLDNIQRCTTSTLSNNIAVCYGIDLARTSDYTVITGMDAKGKLCYFDRFQLPWESTINKIKALPNNIAKIIDSTGVGSVVLEGVQNQINNVTGYHFTNTSKNAIVFELVKDIETGSISFNDITAAELKTFEYKITPSGNMTFNAKSGYHDDCVIALALCNHHRKFYNVSNWSFFSA